MTVDVTRPVILHATDGIGQTSVCAAPTAASARRRLSEDGANVDVFNGTLNGTETAPHLTGTLATPRDVVATRSRALTARSRVSRATDAIGDVTYVGATGGFDAQLLFQTYDPESGIVATRWCLGSLPGACDAVPTTPVDFRMRLAQVRAPTLTSRWADPRQRLDPI